MCWARGGQSCPAEESLYRIERGGGGVNMKDELWGGLGRRELCSWDLALSASEPLPATFSRACLEAAPQPKLECQTGTGARAHPLSPSLDWAQAWAIDP